ncbi:MAG: aminomethyl-transferring glycine dehydrogenase subunit GcvPA [Actinomycetota bacterium]|nr:aminomethyl-transferring glycine dehydrogenase subunit GcvPA [Actinomycetota bacterium]
MRYIPISCEQREAMLRAAGASSIDELFTDIPPKARLPRPLDLPAGMSEMALTDHLAGLARANAPATELVCFAGAGCYDHYIPSVVDHVLRKPEFFTAYTPYQPEVSQGTLQAIFEFQSMICSLTGMDVSNASMYDGATAFVEAALMAARVTRRHRVAVSAAVHPEWLETLRTYAEAGTLELVIVPASSDGRTDLDAAKSILTDEVAALLMSSPAFLGGVEDLNAAGAVAHDVGALLVVGTNPMLLGVMQPPSYFGADIVVGEAQPFGNPMSFGGPGLGFFTCRQEHVRQMPGRLVGQTVDADGNTAYVLTLSTREQHIRREKATSNICSNHALNALAAGVHLAALGREGLIATATACVSKASYFRDKLVASRRFRPVGTAGMGYEFALLYQGDVETMQTEMLERGFLAGVRPGSLCAAAPEGISQDDWDHMVLFAVTEKRSRSEMDAFVEEVASL